MKTENKRGTTLKTACLAIQDAGKEIVKAQAKRDLLIFAAVREFELDGFPELQKIYNEFCDEGIEL